MKRTTITLLLFITTFPLLSQRPPKPERAENAQVVLGNLAQMIGQIGNIIENPHNADNVGNSVSNMVDNIIKITVHAVQNKSIPIADANDIMEQLYNLCKDFNTNIAATITTKKLHLNLLS